MLEEDVAFSSIAQNEIGHARALYQLLADDADALALRPRTRPSTAASPLVELRFVPDWARTIARHVLYEAADELRIERLKGSADTAVAGLAAKIDREEVYHRLHARDVGRPPPRRAALPRGARRSCGRTRSRCSSRTLRAGLAARFELDLPSNNLLLDLERGSHIDEWPALWEEMTDGAPVGGGRDVVTAEHDGDQARARSVTSTTSARSGRSGTSSTAAEEFARADRVTILVAVAEDDVPVGKAHVHFDDGETADDRGGRRSPPTRQRRGNRHRPRSGAAEAVAAEHGYEAGGARRRGQRTRRRAGCTNGSATGPSRGSTSSTRARRRRTRA